MSKTMRLVISTLILLTVTTMLYQFLALGDTMLTAYVAFIAILAYTIPAILSSPSVEHLLHEASAKNIDRGFTVIDIEKGLRKRGWDKDVIKKSIENGFKAQSKSDYMKVKEKAQKALRRIPFPRREPRR